MPKYKATAYIRLSYTDDHSSESDSVSNQRKLIENFVEHNPDIEVVSEKIDDGYSGIIFDRPAFKEMMQDSPNRMMSNGWQWMGLPFMTCICCSLILIADHDTPIRTAISRIFS